ncbi:MAG: molybdopterin cofactor-binding domain-containing protein [Clostridia bacterium]
MANDIIGTNLPRTDGYAKVTGKQRYTQDITFPNMMYAAVLRSPYPHAEILNIDTSEAENFGAICLTYGDINPILYNERSVSVPEATYMDKTVLPKVARYIGEPIAAVACDTEEDANKALKLLRVEYDIKKPVFDPIEAIEDGAPQLYNEICLGDKKVYIKNNIGVIRNIDEGDCDAGFARAEKIFERSFTLNRIYHAQLETKGAVCAPEPDGSLTVYATAQSIHANRQLLGRVLNMPLSKINVKKITIGGAFGSSIQVNTLTPICAALALKADRPIKLIGSREGDFYSHHKYPTKFDVKMGVSKDGMLTAAHVKALVDFGAHQIQPMAYMGCTAGWFASLYKYDGNIRFDGTAVYTNKVPCCAMQGYGNPQVNFAVESMIDIICDEMGFNPIDFRLKNYRGVGSEFWGQGPTIRSIIKSCGVEESLVKGRVIMDFDNRVSPKEKSGRFRRGIGVARGFHTSGTGGPKEGEVIDYSSCMVKVNEDGSVDVISPVMDHGGGTWDALQKIASEVLCVPFDMVGMSDAGTRDTGYDVCTHATRGVYCGGAAVYHVCMKVKELILNMAGEFMREHAYNLELVRSEERRQAIVQVKHFPQKNMTLGEVAKLAQINSRGTMAFTDSYRQRNCPPCFTTHFVEAEVDTETGIIRIPKVLIYGDCGTAVNPELVKGQLIGSFNRGFGYTVFEKLDYDERTGKLKNNGLLVDYKTPSSVEMPMIENCIVKICDTYEPSGPFGAKGIGEAALASVQASIANAVYNAIGIRFTELPITPERVLKQLKEKA